MRSARVWISTLAVAAVALSAAGSAIARGDAVQPTLTVVVLGGGHVTSKPAGISCPGKCTATFRLGTSVVLAPTAKSGTPFLRWGGSCAGSRPCRVRVSSLAAVAAQFAPGKAAGKPPALSRSVAEPGTYSLYNSYRTFFVAPGGKSIANVAVGGVTIACTPAATAAPTVDYLMIARAPIRPNGSFAGKGSQQGMFAGFPATFTYSFTGRFTPATAGKPAAATGTLREDVVFRDNVTHRCTSNTQSWTAVKTGPIPQQAALVRAGKYSLYNSYRTFSVAPGGRSMVNVAIGGVSIACRPAVSGAPATDQIVIARVVVNADGTFTGKSSQNGVFAGAPAKFTYSFSGAFQGANSNGATTVAGLLREDIVFADSGGTHTCTSNAQPWIAVQ